MQTPLREAAPLRAHSPLEFTIVTTWLKSKETADLLKVHPDTARAWRRQGVGPRWTRVGPKLIRYALDDVLAWAREHNYLSTAEEAVAAAEGGRE